MNEQGRRLVQIRHMIGAVNLKVGPGTIVERDLAASQRLDGRRT